MPFELQIMEIIGESIAYGLKLKTQDILMEFETIRQSSYARISIESLRELAFIKSKVDKHHRNADLAHQAWLDLLAYDEDMIGLYLTEYRKSDSSDLSEIELLLESCAKQIAEVCRSVYDLKDSVQNVEITTGFMLDAVRNQLLAFEIRINIITMGFSIGVFITAIYGMNLYSGIEEHPRALLFKSYKLHRPNQNTLPFVIFVIGMHQQRESIDLVFRCALVSSTTIIIWKSLMLLTNCASPIIISLSGDVEPAFISR
ncbi:unnamed protein product, partial [Rotaria sordida]